MQKLYIANRAALSGQALFDHALNAPTDKVAAMVSYINTVCDERTAFEANRERIIDGVLTVGQSPDIKQVTALKDSAALARLCLALGSDPRSFIHPHSLASGKTSSDTSNLKGLKKVREIAETVLLGSDASSSGVGLENVVKVLVACMDIMCATKETDVLERKYVECFLNSPEYRSIAKRDKDLFDSVEQYRAKQMTGGGAKTQVSQTVRMLAAFGAVSDVQNGRSKDIRFHREHPLIDALLIRLGFRTVNAEDASQTSQEAPQDGSEDAPVSMTAETFEAVCDALNVVSQVNAPDLSDVVSADAEVTTQDAPKTKRNRKRK